jgi:hypothetical protein
MKTVKISFIATLAAILAWRIRLPHKVWPAHPQVADLVIAAAISIILQLAWTDPENPGDSASKSADSRKN